MNTLHTPKKSLNKIRHSDNSPVFFTGLAESVKVDSNLLSRCINCGRNISNIWLNARETKKYCTDCEHFLTGRENDPKGCKLNINSNLSSSPEVLHCSSKGRNLEFAEFSDESRNLSHGVKRRFLLPIPTALSNSDDAPQLNESSTSCNSGKKLDYQPLLPSPVRRELKRKCDFDNRPSKRNTFVSPSPKWSLPNDTSDDELSRSIWELYMENKQTKEVFERKMALRNQLHNILLKRFPTCGLYVVGSSMTGLGVNSSDMDMCLMLTDSEIDQSKEATIILRIVRKLFQKKSFLRGIELIYAKVPILKFRDAVSGIEVDLNINSAVGIRNTQLLSSYARLDKRFPPLVVLAKLWARSHDINDAKHNSLSSYSLVLMVVHYLQYGCEPPVLPSLQMLQPDKYEVESDVRKLKLHEDLPHFVSQNKENIGDLFIGFLNYYANEFDYDSSAISIRLGSAIPREDAMNNICPTNMLIHWKCLFIEEPFDLTNTARAVFNADVFQYIKQVFLDSWNSLRTHKDLLYIMN